MPRFADLATVSGKEIKAFDPEARELVEAFHAYGWRSYLSQQGHAIMYAPDGETTASVSGHSRGNLAKTARADLDRWLRRQDKRRKHKHKPLTRSFKNHSKPEPEPQNQPENPPKKENTMVTRFACPDCPDHKPFKNSQGLRMHRTRVHDGFKCPDCGEVFMGAPAEYSKHRQDVHGIEPKKKDEDTLRRKRVRPDADGLFRCEWCGVPFGNAYARAGHSKTHVGQPLPETPPTPVAKKPAEPVAKKPAEPTTNGRSLVPSPVTVHAAPAKPAPDDDAEPEFVTGSADLDTWLAEQDAAGLLANILAMLAPPLVGQIERLRIERDDLKNQVAELIRTREEHEARLQILRDAMSL